ncbi:MAG: hypothetical protein BWY93_02047 [Euryarchaeota archaeon ADurb.BinA087]|nr:MAG: hypothetical protein BWY93_02047 [Euryarchaeota archaeon ADurb.BinA087]
MTGDMEHAERLECKTQIHHLHRMSHPLRTGKVDESPLGKHMHLFCSDLVTVDAIPPLDPACMLLEPLHINLDIEMASICKDGSIPHHGKMAGGDNGRIACCRDEYLAVPDRLVHGHHQEAIHIRFKRTPWIDLGDDDPCAEPMQLPRQSPTAIAVPGNNHTFSRHQHIGSDHDRGEGTLPGTMHVVKESFHGGVIDRDDREHQLLIPGHRPESVDTGGCLLAATNHLRDKFGPFRMDPMNKVHPIVNGHIRVSIEHPVNGSIVFID